MEGCLFELAIHRSLDRSVVDALFTSRPPPAPSSKSFTDDCSSIDHIDHMSASRRNPSNAISSSISTPTSPLQSRVNAPPSQGLADVKSFDTDALPSKKKSSKSVHVR